MEGERDPGRRERSGEAGAGCSLTFSYMRATCTHSVATCTYMYVCALVSIPPKALNCP
jgi:hypothetical protein